MEQAALPVSWYLGSFRFDDPATLPTPVLAELEMFLEVFRKIGFPDDGSACVWFDLSTRKCRHYEHRPTICVESVVPGDESCRKWREIKGVA